MTCTSCVMNKSDKAVVFGGRFSCLDLTCQKPPSSDKTDPYVTTIALKCLVSTLVLIYATTMLNVHFEHNIR